MKLNGNLVLNGAGASEIQNLMIERLADAPTFSSSEKGRVYINTTDNVIYYNNGTLWVAFATGGNAASLQTELDTLEGALGAAINGATGAFVTIGGSTYLGSATSVTGALLALDAAITAHNTLAELDDVTTTGAVTKDVLYFDGTEWVDHTLVLTDISGITATAAEVNELHLGGAVNADFVKLAAVTSTAAELNKLTGATASTTELNYVTGVTSAIQTQLNGKQPLDATLTGVAALGTTANANSLIFTDDGATFAFDNGAGARSKLGLTIGTNVQAFDADLSTLAGFVSSAESSESIPNVSPAFPAGEITHSGLRDFIFSTATPTEGARWNIARGASARTALGMGTAAVHDDTEYLTIDGTHSMAADLNAGGFKVTSVAEPTSNNDATTKNYVDSLIQGLKWKEPVVTVAIANTALTGLYAIDGYTPVVGDRVLVTGQTLPATNGIYVAAAGAWTRAVDADTATEIEHLSVFVEHGTVYVNTTWTVGTPPAVFGTDPIVIVQTNGAANIAAGIGLLKTGNTIDINLGAGIVELPSDEVGIDLYDNATGAIILTNNGSARSADSASKLHLKTNTTQFDQDATNGLFLKASGITATELNASVAGNGLVGGAGTALAVASAAGTSGTVGTLVITSDAVGVALGTTSTTAAPGNHIHAASVVTFTPAGSIVANDVQAAIVEVSGDADAALAAFGPVNTELAAIEASVGLTDGTAALAAFTGANFIASQTTIRAAVVQLDASLNTVNTTLTNKIGKMYFLYSGSSATTHTVTHNLGQKYCNVTVVDATDNVVIPQSIVFTDGNSLVVTFNSAVAAKVVVMGLA